MASISAAWKTDKGRRSANEDSCLVLTAEDIGGGIDGLYIVADGMGGRASGAMASSMAVNSVRESFRESVSRGGAGIPDMLTESLRSANDAVYRRGGTQPGLEGMGTTCVVAAIHNGTLYHAHLGDSRAYLFREGRISRLTEDHSFVAERVKSGELTEQQARQSRFRNVITRAVGLEADAAPEVGRAELKPGDVLLLCTDGLTGPVPDEQIADILCSSPDADEVCGMLVKTALSNGGSDNITAVVVAYGSGRRASRAPAAPPAAARTAVSGRRGLWLLAAVMGLIVGLAAGTWYGPALMARFADRPEAEQSAADTNAGSDLSNVSYGAPESMLYVPLQGGMLALDGQGYLHAVDTQGQLVRVDTSGQIVKTSPAMKELRPMVDARVSPFVCADADGNLYISDPVGRRILKLLPDGTQAAEIGKGQLTGPQALTVDDRGSIYVIDGGRLKAMRVRPSTAADEPVAPEQPQQPDE